MHKIQHYSHHIRLILQFIIFLVPVLNLCFWLTVQTDKDFLYATGIVQLNVDIASLAHEPLTLSTRLFAFLVSMLPCGIFIYALSQLVKLFKSYENANIFTLETADYFKKIGFSFFYWVIGGVLYGGLISAVLSFNNLPGTRIFSLSFASIDFLTILCGFIVLVIAWVMKQAQLIADEQQYTV